MAFDGKLLSGVTVLIAVVEAGTIARAAEALGLSPSGVSRALSRLEQRVGARLLARTTRSLSLTDEGRRFYERVGPQSGRHRGGGDRGPRGLPAQRGDGCASTSIRTSPGSSCPGISRRS